MAGRRVLVNFTLAFEPKQGDQQPRAIDAAH
jgi:hypothetical protein